MKERLVEDWLIRINERGYEVPFCHSLLAGGHRVLRCGHSPTEHGKDVLAIAPTGTVEAYQLKTGDISQSDLSKLHSQLVMLVESRPIHPGLPVDFSYQPYLVTTGEYKDPAVSLVKELNASWKHRGLPELRIINGRQLHADFMKLSSDFWPIDGPSIRQFRELYLTDGRGDLKLSQFASFLAQILCDAKSPLDLERRVAAANLFASYLLGEFYNQSDYWTLVQGWTICAAQIAWAGEDGSYQTKHWAHAFDLSRDAALSALGSLTSEVLSPDSLRVHDRELDDFTRVRNSIAVAAACSFQLISMLKDDSLDTAEATANLVESLLSRNRLLFWSEGAMPAFVTIIWLLERTGRSAIARDLLCTLIASVAGKNSRDSDAPYGDPYVTPDECLTEHFESLRAKTPSRWKVVESYSLFPLVTLAVRRDLRSELSEMWRPISEVVVTWFKSKKPSDSLRWSCELGKEFSLLFDRPQSWSELRTTALRNDDERMPDVLKTDHAFALLFFLTYPHRTMVSLLKHIDAALGEPRKTQRSH